MMKYTRIGAWMWAGAGLFLVFGLLAVHPTLAAECSQIVKLEVPIGDIRDARGLTNHISNLYAFGVSIIGILATVKIMVGGISWATAGGNAQSISEAKEHIYGALIGLGIALLSYIILGILNPSLTLVQEICPEGIQPISQSASADQHNWAACPSQSSSECNGVGYCAYGCSCDLLGNGSYGCVTNAVNSLNNGQPCQNDSNCVEPLTCVAAGANSPGHCGADRGNTSCTSNADCGSGLVCVETNSSNKCLPGAGRLNGWYCEDSSECDGVCITSQNQCANGTSSFCGNDESACLAGYECDTNICRPKQSGDQCDDGLSADCGSGLTCVEYNGLLASHVCSALGIGDPCFNDADCTSGHCLGTTKECVSGATGATCIDDSDCDDFCVLAGGPWCQNGNNGAFCDNDGDCNSGLSCSGNTCLP